MSRTLIAYSTVDGQTLRIATRLRQALESLGQTVTLFEIADGRAHAPVDLQAFDRVVVGASIRYGKHRPAVLRFVQAHRAALEAKASAFFSVNVVARKPGKDRPETNPYVGAFLRRSGWTPALQGVFAGRIDYPSYRLLDRQVIRLIMWMTGGPTDPTTCTEFTRWEAVDAFAAELARLGASAESG